MKNKQLKLEKIIYEYKPSVIDVINSYLYGKICHLTKENGYNAIIKCGYINYSTYDKGRFGTINKCVCLADYRDLSKINQYSEYFSYVSDFSKQNYIFVLNENEYKNIIPPKTEEEASSAGHLVPYYECWYKGIIPLSKIEKIYYIDTINNIRQKELSKIWDEQIRKPI